MNASGDSLSAVPVHSCRSSGSTLEALAMVAAIVAPGVLVSRKVLVNAICK